MAYDISNDHPKPRKRSLGGGRKRKLDLFPTLGAQIGSLLKFAGSPEDTIFRWTVKGIALIANELRAMGVDVSRRIVWGYFRGLGFHRPSSRILPFGRGSDDIDRQFQFAAKAVLAQRDTGGAIIFLDGVATTLPYAQRYREEIFYRGPSKDMLIDEYSREKFKPTSPFANFYACRLERQEANNNPALRKSIHQKMCESTTLPLMNLITDRNVAILTALVLRYWWQSGVATASGCHHGPILILTHGASPDFTFPNIWKWAVNKICKDLGVVISVCRIPPANWTFTGETRPLFSFTAQKDPKTPTREAHFITGRLAFHPCEEIACITGMLDFRRYPKSIKVSARMLRAMSIKADGIYSDWNYSFIPTMGQRPGE